MMEEESDRAMMEEESDRAMMEKEFCKRKQSIHKLKS
jgi:hypothetical protein